ncbi:hypothetical protein N9D31_02020 [Oligoflexaceae bacterium]|nr:hypothetical protein [Oligoflexaceae bacterium]
MSYEVAIGSTAGATDISDWVNVGNVNVFQATGISLSALGTYYASVRAVDAENLKGSVTTGDGWLVSACPAGYIPVPGNTTAGLGGIVYAQGTKSNYDWTGASETIHTTADFCVMKYEAKDGGSHTAVSVAAGFPWVSIQREQAGADNDAQEACENNGAGYQLIGNQHWQAIARNLESVASNYDTSGPVADYTFNHGHADASPNNALAADADDANACLGVTSNGDPDDDCGGVWHINKRSHELSNGEVIWDLSGNVLEWVRDNNSSSQGSNGFIQAVSYSDALKFGPSGDFTVQTGTQKAGLGYFYDGSAGAVFRGGLWHDGASAGPFYAALFGGWAGSGSGVGFRCVLAP